MQNVYDNEIYTCIVIGIDEFDTILAELFGDSVTAEYFGEGCVSFNTPIPMSSKDDVNHVYAKLKSYFGVHGIFPMHTTEDGKIWIPVLE